MASALSGKQISPAPQVGGTHLLGLYVHVPFCVVKCAYCDFYSLAGAEAQAGAYLASLEHELASAVKALGQTPRPRTVFWGGGTPTRLTAEQLAELGRILDHHVDLSGVEEWTVEANPATLDSAKVAALVEAGVTRVSMGAQSFDDAELAWLGREHDAAAIPATVALLRAEGLTQINLDLIFGLPQQTLEGWQAHLEAALALEPTHLSCYNLTYEPGTQTTQALKRGEFRPADPQLEAEMFAHTRARLTAAGLEPYEISNFARPGHECRHNLLYWHNLPYLGLGPSAVSYLQGQRVKNVVSLNRWMASVRDHGWGGWASCERLTGAALAGELAMLALRTRRGLNLADVATRTGCDPYQLFGRAIERFTQTGLLELTNDGHLRLTEAGLFVSDGIMAEFVNPDEPPPAGAVGQPPPAGGVPWRMALPVVAAPVS